MRCRLTRLSSMHQNLRTDSVEGACAFAPIRGNGFLMTAKPLNPAALVRFIETTRIIWVVQEELGKVLKFATQNSVYRWELLDEAALTPIAQPDRATAS